MIVTVTTQIEYYEQSTNIYYIMSNDMFYEMCLNS